jgi:hypothetical protein
MIPLMGSKVKSRSLSKKILLAKETNKNHLKKVDLHNKKARYTIENMFLTSLKDLRESINRID